MNATNPSKPTQDASTGVSDASPPSGSDFALKKIGEALEGLRYGSVLTIVQDGVVVQIERTEKTRFARH